MILVSYVILIKLMEKNKRVINAIVKGVKLTVTMKRAHLSRRSWDFDYDIYVYT